MTSSSSAVAAFLAHVMPLEREARIAFAHRAWERPAAAALHDAAELGDAAQLTRLLASGACEIDATDYDGSTAVHAAATTSDSPVSSASTESVVDKRS